MTTSLALRATGLSKSFGGLQAVDDVSLEIAKGEIVGLIGPNGAGKTTLFNLLTRFERADAGQVFVGSSNISQKPPHRVPSFGLKRTFQGTRIFSRMTVMENLRQGQLAGSRKGAVRGIVARGQSDVRERRWLMDVLEVCGLTGLEHVRSDELPLRDQATLGVAIALASGPDVILLDEPMGGLNAVETESMMQVIREINATGVSILLVEHVMRAVMGLCERVLVLNFGKIVSAGTPAEVSRDPDVVAAYLGTRRNIA